MARVGADTHHRDGVVLHFDVDCLLHGQRQTIASMETPSERDVLAIAYRRGGASYCACAASVPQDWRTGTLVWQSDTALSNSAQTVKKLLHCAKWRRRNFSMPFYKDRVYPHLVTLLGNPKPIQKIRQRIVPLAHGTVLEIGVGPGVNFPLYDPMKVSKIFALEPNPGMIRRAEERQRGTTLDIEFLNLPGERIPLPDGSVDSVVSTFTLCTIPGVGEAIRGIGRLLKPGGKFIFFEHGLAPDPPVRRWQERTEPLFQWAFEGCHLTRDIPSLIREGGFQIEELDTAYLAPFPKSGSHCFWGVALPKP